MSRPVIGARAASDVPLHERIQEFLEFLGHLDPHVTFALSEAGEKFERFETVVDPASRERPRTIRRTLFMDMCEHGGLGPWPPDRCEQLWRLEREIYRQCLEVGLEPERCEPPHSCVASPYLHLPVYLGPFYGSEDVTLEGELPCFDERWFSAMVRLQERARVKCGGREAREVDSPGLQVEQWSDLSIGIDERWHYWAVSRRLSPGEHFPKHEAAQLELRGKQWKTLFGLAANSADGTRAGTTEVLRGFGYLPAPTSVVDDPRARRGAVRDGQVAGQGLAAAGSGPVAQLRVALNDLRRKLRKLVNGPDEQDPTVLVHADRFVQLGFTVQALLPAGGGGHRFGELRNG